MFPHWLVYLKVYLREVINNVHVGELVRVIVLRIRRFGCQVTDITKLQI